MTDTQNAQTAKQPAEGETYIPYYRWIGGEDVPVTITRHAVSAGHELHRFGLGMGGCEMECPDCGDTFHAKDLAQAVDWALSHECE